jgi:hypothetical protein
LVEEAIEQMVGGGNLNELPGTSSRRSPPPSEDHVTVEDVDAFGRSERDR